MRKGIIIKLRQRGKILKTVSLENANLLVRVNVAPG